MIEIRYGLSINENHIDAIEQAARLNEDGKLYAATVFHMAGGREFVIEREEYLKVKHHFEPLTQAEQWAKWDEEAKAQKHNARIETSHYIPPTNHAEATPLLLPENVTKAWKAFDDASWDYLMNDDADMLKKFNDTRDMFLTHFGDFVADMRRKNTLADPIDPTNSAF